MNPIDPIYWYGGELKESGVLERSIDDPGLLYGATVFTTLRVYERSIQHSWTDWRAHCDRLRTSVAAFHWIMPDWKRVQRGAELMSQHYPVLRVTLFPDGQEWITGRALPAQLAQWQREGVTAWLAISENQIQFERSLPHHKTGNYLTAWLARQQAQQRGAQEAILLSSNGDWLETSTGTLWGWANGHWWTPPDRGILPGMLRSRLIRGFKCQNEKISEESWSSEVVGRFEAIAYSNSVVQIVPISQVRANEAFWVYEAHHAGFESLWQAFNGS